MDRAHIEQLKELARQRFLAIKQARGEAPITVTPNAPVATSPTVPISTERGLALNEQQAKAVELAASGESFCLIGAAGTGKTTTMNAAVNAILATHRVPLITTGTKILCGGVPGIAGIAFTRRAAANLRKQMPVSIQSHVSTLHALIEYEPGDIEIVDSEGNPRTSWRFMPQRNASNPLPESLRVILIDEASMLSVELFKVLLEALHHEVQFIFIGDIQQLAPVFGEAILGFKLLSLPVVELTHVYRQALESPIIRLAHRILSGKQITPAELTTDWQHEGQLKIARWPAGTSPERAENTAVAFLEKQLADNLHNPDEDMVLIPFNKHFGTVRTGKRIAELLDRRDTRRVVEVVAGFSRHYLAEGDRLILDNEVVTLKKISVNPAYAGKLHSRPFKFSRFGTILDMEGETDDWLEHDITAIAAEGATDEATHALALINEAGKETIVKSRGAINKLAFAYCTTVHKAQGLQAPRVVLLIHKQHDIMVSRELLYTACTRAQRELTIICENTTLMGGIIKQQIKGTTLAEKAEYFKGKLAKGYKLEEV